MVEVGSALAPNRSGRHRRSHLERESKGHEEIAHYVFTKPNHFAHPAFLFRSTHIEYATRKVNVKIAGATTDTTKERDFQSWQDAFTRMNDEVLRMRWRSDKALHAKLRNATSTNEADTSKAME